MLKLNTKCWISAFNAQGSRGIILVVQVRSVKIYVAIVEALSKNKILWNSGNHSEFQPPWMLMYIFKGFLESHHVYDETRGTGIVFSWLYGYLYCLTDSNESHVREVSVDYFNSTLKSLQNILIWTIWLEKSS